MLLANSLAITEGKVWLTTMELQMVSNDLQDDPILGGQVAQRTRFVIDVKSLETAYCVRWEGGVQPPGPATVGLTCDPYMASGSPVAGALLPEAGTLPLYPSTST